jgi:alpha-glucosidase
MGQLAVLAALVHLVSPNGAIVYEMTREANGRLVYTVTLDRRDVIAPSRLGIVVDGVNLADGAEVGKTETYQVDERYRWFGVHGTAIAKCRGARVALTATASKTPWTIDVRACDDGVGFRYVVPGAAATSRVPDEATVFRVPSGATAWLHDFEGHYEGVHTRVDIGRVAAGQWAATPLTIKLPSGAYASITESAVADYAAMALRADGAGGFVARLGHEEPVSYPYRLRYKPEDIERLAKPAAIAGTVATPWRTIVVGRTLDALVNADIVHSLAPAPDATIFPRGLDTEWIRPGRAVWRYLDGGDNTLEGVTAFNALAEKLGFEYHVVEGLWRRWSDDELRAFVADATRRHVGIWLWQDSRALTTLAEQRAFFDKCRAFGIVGAKIDFFDHDAKEMIDRYQSILREAAAHRILVNFHGANKPTGESRTWPNELTREAVTGLERRSMPEWARHNTTLPFTRFLAGGGDYTPVVFGERRKETSWAHQIATAAVFTSPLLVYGAHPQSLLDNPAVDIITSLPSVWDETVVLPPSEIGELAAFARRSGSTWFVAVLNGPSARTLRIDLGFLRLSRYDALVAKDRMDDAGAVVIDKATMSKGDALTIELRAAGGYIARFTPQR